MSAESTSPLPSLVHSEPQPEEQNEQQSSQPQKQTQPNNNSTDSRTAAPALGASRSMRSLRRPRVELPPAAKNSRAVSSRQRAKSLVGSGSSRSQDGANADSDDRAHLRRIRRPASLSPRVLVAESRRLMQKSSALASAQSLPNSPRNQFRCSTSKRRPASHRLAALTTRPRSVKKPKQNHFSRRSEGWKPYQSNFKIPPPQQAPKPHRVVAAQPHRLKPMEASVKPASPKLDAVSGVDPKVLIAHQMSQLGSSIRVLKSIVGKDELRLAVAEALQEE